MRLWASRTCCLPEEPEEEQRGYFEIIRTNSDLLLRLINDILDVSRLEADRVILSLESCNVVQMPAGSSFRGPGTQVDQSILI